VNKTTQELDGSTKIYVTYTNGTTLKEIRYADGRTAVYSSHLNGSKHIVNTASDGSLADSY